MILYQQLLIQYQITHTHTHTYKHIHAHTHLNTCTLQTWFFAIVIPTHAQSTHSLQWKTNTLSLDLNTTPSSRDLSYGNGSPPFTLTNDTRPKVFSFRYKTQDPNEHRAVEVKVVYLYRLYTLLRNVTSCNAMLSKALRRLCFLLPVAVPLSLNKGFPDPLWMRGGFPNLTPSLGVAGGWSAAPRELMLVPCLRARQDRTKHEPYLTLNPCVHPPRVHPHTEGHTNGGSRAWPGQSINQPYLSNVKHSMTYKYRFII